MYEKEKVNFLSQEFVSALKKLKGDEKGNWGVLSPQGMIEHMTDSIDIASEKVKHPIQTPAEFLEKSKAFAMSDKEFKPGTKNSLMSETPARLRNKTLEDAIHELENSIQNFINHFREDPMKTVENPFFGKLNFQEWLTLLCKHSKHHLKQFNLI